MNIIQKIMSTLSSRIAEAIEAAKNKGYSVADIADRCGVSVQAVYQWIDPMNNMKELKGHSLVGLADISGLSPWYIDDGSGEKILFYAKNEQQKAALKIMEPLPLNKQEVIVRLGHTIAEPSEGTNGKQ